MLQRKVADAVKAAGYSGKPQFTGFLNDRQRQLAEAMLHRLAWRGYCFDGGYEGAERAMLCVFEDKETSRFPFSCLRIQVNRAENLTHRDYLGALLGLGLRRETLGDILVEEAGAKVFVAHPAAQFVCRELCEVSRFKAAAGVCSEPAVETGGEERADTQSRISVASLRLDAVLAAMLGISRSAAVALVAAGKVQVNHLLVESAAYSVQEGDVFSVWGEGKFQLGPLAGQSKKGRLRAGYRKY